MPMKVTNLQHAVLVKLHKGSVITVDSLNRPFLDDQPLSPQTKYYLTSNRLVTRVDKTKLFSSSNGYTISEEGLKVLKVYNETSPRLMGKIENRV